MGSEMCIRDRAGTVGYGYNAAGEQVTLTQPEGVVTTGYDVNGFVDSVSDWRGDTITMVNDADGRMIDVARSNGVHSVYGYDAAGRLNNIAHANGAAIIDEFAYTLDGNGNRTAVTSNAGTESYVLDGLNRITAATYPGALTEAFSYDAAGNRTSHTDIDGATVGYTVDATGQLISDTTGTTYTYDQAGNLTGTSDGDAYTYDDYGRATSITAGGVTETYGYDAADVRVAVNGVTQLWDRNGLPALISTGAGDNYVHVDGVARDGNDWLLQDAIGSVRATVDQAGVVSAETAFTAFGEPLNGQTDSFGFAGEQLDTTGLLHLRARQYNPTVGRFNTVDPLQPGAPGTTGYNLYTYAANNPTTFTDPTGQAVFAEDGFLRGRAAPAIRGFARPAAFGCIRDALIGSAFELGTVAATDQTFSTGRLGGTAVTDCAVGVAFGAFRATNAFDQLGFGGRRATTFLEGFAAVGGSDTLFGGGFNFDRAVGGGIAGAALDGIAEVVAGRLLSGSASAATPVQITTRTVITNVPGFNSRGVPSVLDNSIDGSGFSGAFDSVTGQLIALPSQPSVLASTGVAPSNIVPRRQGHLPTSLALEQLTGTSSANHVGFAITPLADGTLQISWNSGVLNLTNFGAREAPERFRDSIVEAIEQTTGMRVSSR